MERIETLHSKIQSIVNQLIKTPDNREQLEKLQLELRADWDEYQRLTKEIRPTITDTAELEYLDESVTRALKTFNIADQGITNKLEKLNEDEATKPQPKLEPTGENTTNDTQEQSTSQTAPANRPKGADVEVLHALLEQISGQFNEILAGHFPKPDTKSSDPIVGATQCTADIDGEDNTGYDVASPCKHRASAVIDPDQNSPPECPTTTCPATTSPTTTSPTTTCPATTSPATTTATVTADTIQQPTLELRMDKFILPTFDGDLTNWLSFRDQFSDLVDKNQKYTAITKFIQLRNHLKGSALEAIKGFKLSAANYDAAWHILKRRYDKPDRIIDEYLQQLDDLPILSGPSAQKLIAMVNCTNQILRVLPTLGIDTSTWDAIIKHHLVSKLDRATHKKWLDEVKLRQGVPLQELIEFLEIEASENLPLQQKGLYQRDRRGNDRPKGHVAAVLTTVAEDDTAGSGQGHLNREKCPQCKGNHPLFLCGTFKKLKVKDRINKVRSFKLCGRCLRKHEHPSECKFGMCPTCTKDHNSLLCYQKERQFNEATPRVANLHSTPE